MHRTTNQTVRASAPNGKDAEPYQFDALIDKVAIGLIVGFGLLKAALGACISGTVQ